MKNLLQCLLWPVLCLAAGPVFSQDFNLQFRSTLEYPGQTLANICGYAQGGREYALVGASKGLVIVDVTNPDNPVNITQLPGPDNLWKEIKTYDHYAYVTSEGGQGIQIVDLSALPNPNVTYHFYTAAGQIPGGNELDQIHALHIDGKKGFLYAYGGPMFSGGAKVFDLNADPNNPVYVGKFDAQGYIHDGFVYNDTLYACHINTGILSIVDMSDKSNPVLLGTVQTPGKFTHNSWLLDDHKHILTTDEKQFAPSFVTSYDISDPQDIKELDRSSTTNDATNSIGHNVHVLNDWAITSWYTDGVVIADAHRPDNIVITGWYDTWPGTGSEFNGCWGVYPFLPSGTIVASNIPFQGGSPGKLFVLKPTYVRACYLEGVVKSSCTGLPMNGAKIEVNSNNPWINTTSRIDGTFKTGQLEPGNFTVTISKTGYFSKTLDITLATAQVTEVAVTLDPELVEDVDGTVLQEVSSTPVENANVTLTGPDGTYQVHTNAAGQFKLPCVPPGTYTAIVGAWGYLVGNVSIDAGTPVTIFLKPGYYDDFETDLNWTTEATAPIGLWERGEPVGTVFQTGYSNPENDINLDGNDQCYVTGNSGGQAGSDDVDNGSVTLTCPPMLLGAYPDAVLTFWYWFYNSGGQGTPPNDQLEVRVTGGNQTVTLLTETVSQSAWRYSGEIHLKDYVTLTDDIQVQFIATDNDPGHIVEAAVDYFQVVPKGSSTATSDTHLSGTLATAPNPSSSSFSIHYNWQGVENPILEVRNPVGQVVFTQTLSGDSGVLSCGGQWPNGVYMAVLKNEGRQSAPLRLVKQ